MQILLLVICALVVPVAGAPKNAHSWKRVALTGRRILDALNPSSRHAVSAIPAPQLPDQCNFFYDSQQGYAAEQMYQQVNSNCLSAFTTCLQSQSAQVCNGICTANIDMLENQCDTTYCELSGDVDVPVNPNVPPFHFRMGGCYPDDCDEDTHDSVQSYLQYNICGPALYGGPDCAAFNLECGYDLSTQTIWIIVGAVLGFFVLACGSLFTWWYCARRKIMQEEDAEGEYVQFLAAEQDTFDNLHSNNSGYSSGVTFADMRMSRPGAVQNAMLDDDSRL